MRFPWRSGDVHAQAALHAVGAWVRPEIVTGFGLSDIGDAINDAANAVGDVAGAVANVVTSIPGVGDAAAFFGEKFKDFANTALGQTVMTAFASFVFPEVAAVVGPQLAAVVFAAPGVAKGDAFVKSWLVGFTWRLEQLCEILGGQAAAEVAQSFEPIIDQIIAQAKAAGVDPAAYASKLENFTEQQLSDLAKQLGVREDMLQMALDYLAAQVTAAYQVWTPYGSIPIPGKDFDPTTGKQIDPTTGKIFGASLATSSAHATRVGPSMAAMHAIPIASAPTLPARKIAIASAVSPAVNSLLVTAKQRADAGDPRSQEIVNAVNTQFLSITRIQWVNHYAFGAALPSLPSPPTMPPAVASPAPSQVLHDIVGPSAAIAPLTHPSVSAVQLTHPAAKTITFHGTLPAPSAPSGMHALLNPHS